MSEQLAAETKVDELAKNVENYLETPINQLAMATCAKSYKSPAHPRQAPIEQHMSIHDA